MKDIKKEMEKLRKNEFFIKSLEGLVNYFERCDYNVKNPEIKAKIEEYGFFIAEKVFESLNSIELKVQKNINELKISDNPYASMYSFLNPSTQSKTGSKRITDNSTSTNLDVNYNKELGLNFENYENDNLRIKISIEDLISLTFEVKNGLNNKPKITFENYSIFDPMKNQSANHLFAEGKPLPIIHFLRNIVKDNLRQSLKIVDSINKEELKQTKKTSYKI